MATHQSFRTAHKIPSGRTILGLQPLADGYQVFRRGVLLGKILTTCEPSGRAVFTFDADRRPFHRTYRGRDLAAEALAALYDAVQAVKTGRVSLEEALMTAWEQKPVAARQS